MQKLMIAIAGAMTFGLSALAADPIEWFNGGVATGWPNASTLSGGAWGSDAADLGTFADGTLEVDADAETPLTFTATTSHKLTTDTTDSRSLSVSSTMTFFPLAAEPTTVPADAKVGVCVYDGKYYVVANEGDGANYWTNTEISVVSADVPVAVTIVAGPAGVTYTIGGTAFNCTANLGDKTFSAVKYTGNGTVTSLTSTYTPDTNWTGTGADADHPFVIGNKAGLDELVTKTAAGNTFAGKFFKLDTDLDLSEAGAFAGIKSFAGIFDGNNKLISNVTMTDRKYAGIFDLVSGTVENLTVSNIYFTGTSGEWGGAIVGQATGGAVMSNLTMKGTVGSESLYANHNVAGILVKADVINGGVLIEDCANEASVYGAYSKLAGIVVFSGTDGGTTDDKYRLTVRRCTNTGSLYANYAGSSNKGMSGILGMSLGRSEIDTCVNSGSVIIADGSNMDPWCGTLVGTVCHDVDLIGANVVSADEKAYGSHFPGYTSKVQGLKFATVADDVATFCEPVAGKSYKVMVEDAAFALGADESITLDETFYTATVTATAAAAEAGYMIKKDGNVYTAVKAGAKIGTTLYLTLNDAIKEAGASDMIELCGDAAVSGEIAKVVNLDLAGHNLQVGATDAKANITIVDNGATKGQVGLAGLLTVYDGAVVSMATIGEDKAGAVGAGQVFVKNGGSLVYPTRSAKLSPGWLFYAWPAMVGGEKGGKITTDQEYVKLLDKTDDGEEFWQAAGDIAYAKVQTNSHASKFWYIEGFSDLATAIVWAKGANPVVLLKAAELASVNDAATIQLNGQTLSVTGDALDKNLTVTGAGTVSCSGTKTVGAVLDLGALDYAQVSGLGSLNIAATGKVIFPKGVTYPDVLLAIGTKGEGAKIVVANGTETYTWGNGVWTAGEAAAVAKIGTTGYATLAEAVAAATADQTVTLLADVTLDATIAITKTTTIDLGNKTITLADALAKGFNAANGSGTLTIKNGTIASATGRTNIAGSRVIMLNQTSGVFKDLTLDVPGFEYAIDQESNLGDYGKAQGHYWTDTPAWTSVCENVTINGNGSLFHFENAVATLDNCATTIKGEAFDNIAHRVAIYSSCGSIVTINSGSYAAANALQTGTLGGTIVVNGGAFTGDITSFMGWQNQNITFAQNKAYITLADGTYSGAIVFKDDKASSRAMETITKGTDVVLAAPTGYKWLNDTTLAKTYTVAAATGLTGGTVAVDKETAAAGETITVTATPATDYTLATITTNGQAITGNTFVMPAENVTVSATFTENQKWNVTFTTNTIEIAGSATTVYDGKSLTAAQIPVIAEAGAWDVNPINAVITCNTNFNYTVQSITPVDPSTGGTIDVKKTGKTAAEVAQDATDHPEKYVQKPAGLDDQYAAGYKAMFEGQVVDANTVKMVLKPEVVSAVSNTITTAATTIDLGKAAAGTEQTINVELKPGLWYNFKAGSEVDDLDGTPFMANATSYEYKPAKQGTAGFYTIKAGVTEAEVQ